MIGKKNIRIYQGSEVIQTEAKLLIKAYIDAFLISFLFQLVFLLLVLQFQVGVYNFMHALITYSTAKFYASVGLSNAHTYKLCTPQGICGMYPASIAAIAYKRYLLQILSNLSGWALFSFLIYLVSVPAVLKVFKKRADKLNQEKLLRGRDITPESELVKTLPNPRRLPISKQLRLPVVYEPQHLLVLGKTGMGKTTLIAQMLQKLREAGFKVIVYDYKGDYIQKFYREGKDYLFNPLDKRSVRWTIFNDVQAHQGRLDIENIVNSLIPPSAIAQNERFWLDAAKAVFIGIINSLLLEKEKPTNADIWKVLSMDNIQLQEYLIEHGQNAAAKFLATGKDSQAGGVVSTLLTFVRVLEYMAELDGDFSFQEWLKEDDGGWLFLVNRADAIELLRPVLTLAVDLLARRVLTLPDDNERRIFFFVDEIGTLQKMPSLKEFLTNSRSKGGCLVAGVQDIAQVAITYGREFAYSTFVNNFSNMIVFGVEGQTAKLISDSFGQKEVLVYTDGFSFGPDEVRDGTGVHAQHKITPVVLPSELSALRRFQIYVRFAEGQLTKTRIVERFIPALNIEPFIPSENVSLLAVKKQAQEIKDLLGKSEESGGSQKEISDSLFE